MMFRRMVAIEPVHMEPEAEALLSFYAHRVKIYQDIPQGDDEIIRRIGDADAVLLSYTSHISGQVIDACPRIRYIGMCCSLYAPESANVDMAAAEKRGIAVTGIRDYGDEGVVEYVVSELVRLLHGFGGRQWKRAPLEITGMKIGVLGLGTTGRMVAKGLQFFGGNLYYYSRTRKPEAEKDGIQYLPLNELLKTVDILCTCLNKNVVLLHKEEFASFGNGKILINTSIGPSFDVEALKGWLACKENYYLCDTLMAMGEDFGEPDACPNVICPKKTAGASAQSNQRLGQKVIENIQMFLASPKERNV